MMSNEAYKRYRELFRQAHNLRHEAREYLGWWIALRRRCLERSQPIDEDACEEIERAEARVRADAALLDAQAYMLCCDEQHTNVVLLSV